MSWTAIIIIIMPHKNSMWTHILNQAEFLGLCSWCTIILKFLKLTDLTSLGKCTLANNGGPEYFSDCLL